MKKLIVFLAAALVSVAVYGEAVSWSPFSSTYGTATIAGDSDTGIATLTVDAQTASGNLTVASNLTVNGDTTLGNATGDTVNITGWVQSIKVVGATTLGDATNDTVSIAGYVIVPLNVQSSANFAGGVTSDLAVVSGTFNAGGATTLDGNVTLGNATTDVVTVHGLIDGSSGATNGFTLGMLYTSNSVVRVYGY